MKFGKKAKEKLSGYLIYFALAAVGLAGLGYLGRDIWLASTQWLLVATVLILFGIYLRI